MLLDSEKLQANSLRDKVFDACIVGSGPAGMTLAMKLAEKGWKVGLFEGGGLEPTIGSNDLYRGKVVGHDYFPLTATRLRYFGGTSNHWNGRCRRLDPFDFVPNSNSPYSGWPIRSTDLDAYADEAEKVLDVGWANPLFDLFQGGSGSFEPIQFRWSKPTRFGDKYKDTLTASQDIQAFYNANLIDLDLAPNHRRVSSATFRTYAQPKPFTVLARYFALCLGGLENPRFLLNATRQVPNGIGNENDLVGRFFCEHLLFHLGDIIVDPKLQAGLQAPHFYRPTPKFVTDNRVLNFALELDDRPYHTPDTASFSLARRTVCDVPPLDRVLNAMRGVEMSCYDSAVGISSAQQSNPDSRVRLGSDKDKFGHRRIELDWRLEEIDKRTLTIAAMEFGKQLAVRNVGRMKVNDWVLDPKPTFPTRATDEVGGNHHMCTTRMSDHPKTGVVDRNCRIHSVDNLYAGGSSVFSTPGYANPTFTVVQLSLRLADHLDSRLKSKA